MSRREVDVMSTLNEHWDALRQGDELVSREDLEQVAASSTYAPELRDAARYLLDHPDFLQYRLDVANQGGKPDGKISTDDLTALLIPAYTDAIQQKGASDPALANSFRQLLDDPKFKALDNKEQLAVLSQAYHYPEAHVVDNLRQLVGKDWFNDFNLEDQQRSLKTVAFLSQSKGGDRAIIDNTLNHYLADDATLQFDWNETNKHAAGTASADTATFHFNPRYVTAGNGPIDPNAGYQQAEYMATHVFAHETNHLLNGDKVEQSYRYFMAEYRAWHVGFKAQHERDPTQAEAAGRAQSLLRHGDIGAYDNIHEALSDPVEGPKIVDFMKKVLGRDDVTQDNAAMLPPKDPTKPGPAPEQSSPTDPNNVDNS